MGNRKFASNMQLKHRITIVVGVALLFGLVTCQETDSCARGEEKQKRYLLYDVNPGEGFNLRRDVYLRIANLVHKLSETDNWVLVLPPWGRLYHWRNTHPNMYFPWSSFFDIASLNKWINVIEFQDFFKAVGPWVEVAVQLQHYAEGWGDKWEEKYDTRPCTDRHTFHFQENEGVWHTTTWNTEMTVLNFSCVSIHGRALTLRPLLTHQPNIRTIFILRAETVLHDEYGGKWYWAARRSMRFAYHLQQEASAFRSKYLNSTDVQDKTEVAPDWRDTKIKRGTAVGGPYLSVHLRRQDFVYARRDDVPTLKKAAKQIKKLLKAEKLNAVFVATDAPHSEFVELKSLLADHQVVRFEPSTEFLGVWGEGGAAVVDQIICTHAQYFIGSYESTFSFRIQEEREILGFEERTTFNRLCGKNPDCEQPAKWRIEY